MRRAGWIFAGAFLRLRDGPPSPGSRAAVERMARSLKNAELKIVRQSGHFVPVEKGEEYFAAIEAFLGRK
jgi:pimeloyl-ACP methyl ester carboxylesterase